MVHLCSIKPCAFDMRCSTQATRNGQKMHLKATDLKSLSTREGEGVEEKEVVEEQEEEGEGRPKRPTISALQKNGKKSAVATVFLLCLDYLFCCCLCFLR